MDKNQVAMEELKEVDMNYLINEDSDADEMFQLAAVKKKTNRINNKKETEEVTFQTFNSPYIEAEQRRMGVERPASGDSTNMAPEEQEDLKVGSDVENDVIMPMSRDDLRPDIDEELIVRDMMYLNNNQR